MPRETKSFLSFLLLRRFEPPAPGVTVLPRTSGRQKRPTAPSEWRTPKTDSVSASCQVCGDLLRPARGERRGRDEADTHQRRRRGT